MRSLRARAAVAVTVLAGLLVLGGPAGAHTELSAAEPEADSTVTAPPARVRLDFSGPLQADGDHALGLFGPDGARVDDGTAVLVGDRSVEVGVAPLAGAGVHTVRYLVVAGDGHALEGEYTFTYAGPVASPSPPPSTSPSPSAARTAEPAPPVGPTTAPPSPAAAAAPTPAGEWGPARIPAAAVALPVIGVAAAALALAARRRRP